MAAPPSGVSVALYRSLLHRINRGRLRELLDTVPFRVPTTALPLCGEEAFVAAGQPIPTLRHNGQPISLAPPPVATRKDVLRLIQSSFRKGIPEGEEGEQLEGAFEGLRRLTSLQSQLEGLVQTREKRDEDRGLVQYSIGEVLRHKNFGYRGVVVGWDGRCNRPVEWLEGNGMLPKRGQQPFYHIIPDQPDCIRLFGDTRESKYVAEDNLEPIEDIEERCIDHEHLMAFFSRYSPGTGSFVPCEEVAFIYPDEYPTVTEEEDMAKLIVAAQRGDLPLVKEKLQLGADVDALDQWGNGALHWASHHGHHECVEVLLEHGADPDLVHSNFGITPLHLSKDVAVLNLLLARGANPWAVDQEGYSVQDWAGAAKRDELVAVLGSITESSKAKDDPRRPAANLAEFCRTLSPVEVYEHTSQARGRYFGRYGSELIHIIVFSSSKWTEESTPKPSSEPQAEEANGTDRTGLESATCAHEDVLTAMRGAYDTYRPATFMNVVVDIDDPSNSEIVRQFGMAKIKSPSVRALSFDRTGQGTAMCDQSLPEFEFVHDDSESYTRFAKQLEEIALAPTVTVRPEAHMGGVAAGAWTEDVSSIKVRLAVSPSPASLAEGTAVVATHPSYGPHRWWDATVVARDADSTDGEDEGVFLEFDDGDQAYRKLDQLRLAEPLKIGDKQGDEPEAASAAEEEVETAEQLGLADGVEVLVQGRQYTHNGAGPYYEWTRGEVVAPQAGTLPPMPRIDVSE